jgi:hypothetical protein
MEIYIWWKYFKILMMQYINLKEGDNDQLLLSFFTSTFQNLDWSTAPPPPSGAPDVEAVFLDLHGRFLLSCQPKASPIFSQSIVARLRYRYIVKGKKKTYSQHVRSNLALIWWWFIVSSIINQQLYVFWKFLSYFETVSVNLMVDYICHDINQGVIMIDWTSMSSM